MKTTFKHWDRWWASGPPHYSQSSRMYRRTASSPTLVTAWKQTQKHFTDFVIWKPLVVTSNNLTSFLPLLRCFMQTAIPICWSCWRSVTSDMRRLRQVAQLSQRDRAAGWVNFGRQTDERTDSFLVSTRCMHACISCMHARMHATHASTMQHGKTLTYLLIYLLITFINAFTMLFLSFFRDCP